MGLGGFFGGSGRARRDIERAYQEGKGSLQRGYQTARGHVTSGFGQGRTSLTQGYDRARQQYQASDVVGSRQELYNRYINPAGGEATAVGGMKKNIREQAAVAGGEAQRLLRSNFRGDSTASGLAAENFGRAYQGITANSIQQQRDAEAMGEAWRQNAINSLYGMAQNEAGLEERAGQNLSMLDVNQGLAMSGLSTDEAQWLANMAMSKGSAMANTRSNPLANIAMVMQGLNTAANVYRAGKS